MSVNGGTIEDPVSSRKLGAILFGVALLVTVLMVLEAERSGQWRELWVSSAQVWISVCVLYALLRPRR